MSVDQLRRQLTVFSTETGCWIAQPVVVVNQKEIVAGIQYPAKPGLPAEIPAVVIVLNVIGQ